MFLACACTACPCTAAVTASPSWRQPAMQLATYLTPVAASDTFAFSEIWSNSSSRGVDVFISNYSISLSLSLTLIASSFLIDCIRSTSLVRAETTTNYRRQRKNLEIKLWYKIECQLFYIKCPTVKKTRFSGPYFARSNPVTWGLNFYIDKLRINDLTGSIRGVIDLFMSRTSHIGTVSLILTPQRKEIEMTILQHCWIRPRP